MGGLGRRQALSWAALLVLAALVCAAAAADGDIAVVYPEWKPIPPDAPAFFNDILFFSKAPATPPGSLGVYVHFTISGPNDYITSNHSVVFFCGGPDACGPVPAGETVLGISLLASYPPMCKHDAGIRQYNCTLPSQLVACLPPYSGLKVGLYDGTAKAMVSSGPAGRVGFKDMDYNEIEPPRVEFEFEGGLPRAVDYALEAVNALVVFPGLRFRSFSAAKLCPLYTIYITTETSPVVQQGAGRIGVVSEAVPHRMMRDERGDAVLSVRVRLDRLGAQNRSLAHVYTAQLGVSLERRDLEAMKAGAFGAAFAKVADMLLLPEATANVSRSFTFAASRSRLAFLPNPAEAGAGAPQVFDDGRVENPEGGCYRRAAFDPQAIALSMSVRDKSGPRTPTAEGLVETEDSLASVNCSFAGLPADPRDLGVGGLFLALLPADRLAAFKAGPPGASLLANFYDTGALQAVDLRLSRALRDGFHEFTFPCASREQAASYKCALVAGSSARTGFQAGHIDERGAVADDEFNGLRPLLDKCPDWVVKESAGQVRFALGAAFGVSEPKVENNRLGCVVDAPGPRCESLAVAIATKEDLEEMRRQFERDGPRVSGGRALRHIGFAPLNNENASYAYAREFVGVEVTRPGPLQGAVCLLASVPRSVDVSASVFKISAEAPGAALAPPPPVAQGPGESLNPPDESRPAIAPEEGVLPPADDPADVRAEPDEVAQRQQEARLDPASATFQIPAGPVPLLRDPIDQTEVSGAEAKPTVNRGEGARGADIVPTRAFRDELGRMREGPPSAWPADYKPAQGKSAPRYTIAFKPFVSKRGNFSVRVELGALNRTLDGADAWRVVPARSNPTGLAFNVTARGPSAAIDFTRGCSEQGRPVDCPDPAAFEGRYSFDLEFRSSAGGVPVAAVARLELQGGARAGGPEGLEAAARDGARACGMSPECTPCVFGSPLNRAFPDEEGGQAFPRWGFCAPKNRTAADPMDACVLPAGFRAALTAAGVPVPTAFKSLNETQRGVQKNPINNAECPASEPGDFTAPSVPPTASPPPALPRPAPPRPALAERLAPDGAARRKCLATRGCGVCAMPNGDELCRPGDLNGPLDFSCDPSAGEWTPAGAAFKIVLFCRTYQSVLACLPRAPAPDSFGAAECEDGSGAGIALAVPVLDLKTCRAEAERANTQTGNRRLDGAAFDAAVGGEAGLDELLEDVLDREDEVAFLNALRRLLQHLVDYSNSSAYQAPPPALPSSRTPLSLELTGQRHGRRQPDPGPGPRQPNPANPTPAPAGPAPAPAPANPTPPPAPGTRRGLLQAPPPAPANETRPPRPKPSTGRARMEALRRLSRLVTRAKNSFCADPNRQRLPVATRKPRTAAALCNLTRPVVDPLSTRGARPRDVVAALGVRPPTQLDVACDACAGIATLFFKRLNGTFLVRKPALYCALNAPYSQKDVGVVGGITRAFYPDDKRPTSDMTTQFRGLFAAWALATGTDQRRPSVQACNNITTVFKDANATDAPCAPFLNWADTTLASWWGSICPSFVSKALAKLDKAASDRAGRRVRATVMSVDAIPQSLDMLALECSAALQTRLDARRGGNAGCRFGPRALPPDFAEMFRAAKARGEVNGTRALPSRRPRAAALFLEFESEAACNRSLAAGDALVQAEIYAHVAGHNASMGQLAPNHAGPAGRRALLQAATSTPYVGYVPVTVNYDASSVDAPLPDDVLAALAGSSIASVAGGRVAGLAYAQRALRSIALPSSAAADIAAALALNCTAGDAACLEKQQAGAAAACSGGTANAEACKAIQEKLLGSACAGAGGGCGLALGLVCKSDDKAVKALCKSLARVAVEAKRGFLLANFAALFPKGRPASLRVFFEEALGLLVVFVRGAEYKVTSVKTALYVQHPDKAACLARRAVWSSARVGFVKQLVLALNALRNESVYYTSVRARKGYACDEQGRASFGAEVLDGAAPPALRRAPGPSAGGPTRAPPPRRRHVLGDLAALREGQRAGAIFAALQQHVAAGAVTVDGLRVVQIGEGASEQVTRAFFREEDLAFVSGLALVPTLPYTTQFILPVPAACANLTEGYLPNDDDVDFDGSVAKLSLAGEMFRLLNASVPGVARTSIYISNITCSATEGMVFLVTLGMPANDTSEGGLYMPPALDPDTSAAPAPAADTPAPAANATAANATLAVRPARPTRLPPGPLRSGSPLTPAGARRAHAQAELASKGFLGFPMAARSATYLPILSSAAEASGAALSAAATLAAALGALLALRRL
eukprot:tig00001310_g8162.t1